MGTSMYSSGGYFQQMGKISYQPPTDGKKQASQAQDYPEVQEKESDNTGAIVGGIIGGVEGGIDGAIEGALIGSLLDD